MNKTPVCTVRKAGLFTTVQDTGRTGYQHLGVPASGAMDMYALQMGNALCGNHLGAAGLELTLMGPTLTFHEKTVIAVTGGNLQPAVNKESIPMWATRKVYAGDELTFNGPAQGARAYLCIEGGIEVPMVLGSRSTYTKGGIGGMEGRELESGDILYRGTVHSKPKPFERRLPAAGIPVYEKQQTLRVVAGPEFDTLTTEAGAMLLREAYVVTQEADRMGIRLRGPEVSFHHTGDIISDGVAFGTIQLASDGQPMILMADRQTTGGYARVLNVISADLLKAAQLQPNATVKFEQVTLEEAKIAFRQLHRSLEDVYFAVNNKKWR
ncbi:biotin-dependent carboxylase uncharacterized domain-containing protein [Marinococcus luteus]|uniref:Biotin-dependent carboxylase uncharacterized domain-containing protein n=1 Tax=Marinococcus luteus TaxID=1122204 RepID=A0A1H2Y8Q2_9BACI|nr:biotin-dependent carboxyltransferase family protein [Marinococcus luteus]SDX00939.1 biotin-dependent carboxylase uncharacterized domain-containing protein [Marinococcus luteus]